MLAFDIAMLAEQVVKILTSNHVGCSEHVSADDANDGVLINSRERDRSDEDVAAGLQPAHLDGLVLYLAQQAGEAGLSEMLDLNDDFVSRGGVAEVNSAIFTSFEAFHPDTPMRLKKVPGEDLEVVRRQLMKVVLGHGSAQVDGPGKGEISIMRSWSSANRKMPASLPHHRDRPRGRG